MRLQLLRQQQEGPLAESGASVQACHAQVAELLVGIAAPVLYWEQGHEWLFGDPVRFQVRSAAVNAACKVTPPCAEHGNTHTSRPHHCTHVQHAQITCTAQVAHNYARQDQLFHMVLHLPMALAAVSEAVQAILRQVRLPQQGSP